MSTILEERRKIVKKIIWRIFIRNKAIFIKWKKIF